MTGTEESLSFLGLADIAVRLVKEEYPDAELYEGDGESPSGPTTNVHDVNKWGFVFRVEGGSVTIKTKSWGEFYPPEHHGIFVGDRIIPWPIKMDITEADEILKNYGYTGEYTAATLRWPLYPGLEQPFYIFSTPEGHFFVGVYEKNVTPPKEINL
jgi:hypothetical protein